MLSVKVHDTVSLDLPHHEALTQLTSSRPNNNKMDFIFWKHLYLWWYRSLVLIFCMSDIFLEVLTYGGRETCGTSALIPPGYGNLLSFKTVNLVYSWSEWWKNVSRKWLSPNMRGKTYGFFSDMSLKVSMLHIAEAKLNTGYCHNSEGDEQCKGGRHGIYWGDTAWHKVRVYGETVWQVRAHRLCC